MPILTLTSDYGTSDHYVAAVKGYVLSKLPNVQIVDICHAIEPFNLPQAAHIFKNAYQHFPQNTIHLCCIDSTQFHTNRYLIIEHQNQFFIGPDNGFFSLIRKEWPKSWISVRRTETGFGNLDPLLEVIAPTAIKLIENDMNALQCGTPTQNAIILNEFQAVSFQSQLQGVFTHIDHYGNLITNISRAQFEDFIGDSNFEIRFRGSETLRKISNAYTEVFEGECLALFNMNNQLEIALNADKASVLLGIRKGETISVFKV